MVVVLCGTVAFAVSGCAFGRSEIPVEVPHGEAAAGLVPVRITEVRDRRQFSTHPPDASMPSLGDEADIGNPAITTRAIGRKRNGYGMALGDIVLPEGSTVPGLVRDAARQALAARGYRVVEANSPDYARTPSLALDINQFWTWFSPGFWQITLRFDALIRMKGNMVAAPNDPAHGHAEEDAFSGVESNWQEVVQAGLKDLVRAMEANIAPASGGS
ncbi:MAG TPA: hypothetical protein VFC54_00345 [Pseudolabrys sp.]|nr:hypothetical protein [Pseudolabrys sp.]